ncbi:4Fe-4S dicluster domain-containing protein [Variibacter gotjawalensis]|nr:4Fe-4S binding protein [Variibacter gotjawalensis]
MPLDTGAISRGCPQANVSTARHLCRTQTDHFLSVIADGGAVTVACTQEAPLFDELAESVPSAGPITFANIREMAGWSRDAVAAGPKMAALLAMAEVATPATPLTSLTSDGVILIYGCDQRTIEVAELLKDHLDITVMLNGRDPIEPPHVTDFPIVRGTIGAARGHLGAFELTIDGYAQPSPSSREALRFGPPRDGATSRCDIILDVSGGAPLFPAHDLRDGYLRVDPRDPAAVLRAVLKARDLVGTFDKPRYVTFTKELCAHSRSKIVGCRRCLDLCPTGAIVPAGNYVAIDPNICAGCGQCAAACPTGAAAYTLPPADTLIQRLRALLTTFARAGGQTPVVLIHDTAHGDPLIDAIARHGDGLPARVLPVQVNEVTQVGLESIAAAFAYGASQVRFLLRGKARHDTAGLTNTIALAQPILSGLGFTGDRLDIVETDDPFALGETLRTLAPLEPTSKPAQFNAAGPKRDVMRLTLRELHAAAPMPVDVIPLPSDAPFGSVSVNVEGCTLCLACVSACPKGALSDDREQPMLRFTEAACVQCGLCEATCPEKVITLVPQLDFNAFNAPARVIKQEEPFHCIRCDKPFGVKSTIERVAAKLEGRHWMYRGGESQRDVIRMCEDCRVSAVMSQDFNPYGAPDRPPPRTTDDYLRERAEREQKS